MSKIEQKIRKENRLRELQAKYAPMFLEAANLEKEIFQLSIEIEKEINEEKAGNPISIEGVMSLDWCRVQQPLYGKIQKFLEGFKGVYFGGFNNETNQLLVQVCLTKNKKIEEQMDVELFIPYILPLKDGTKFLGVFERTASEFGSYYLEIKDNKFLITNSRYHNRNTMYSFNTLKEALLKIKKDFYYMEN